MEAQPYPTKEKLDDKNLVHNLMNVAKAAASQARLWGLIGELAVPLTRGSCASDAQFIRGKLGGAAPLRLECEIVALRPYTFRIQNPDTLRAGRVGAAHGGAAREAGLGRTGRRRVDPARRQPSLLSPLPSSKS